MLYILLANDLYEPSSPPEKSPGSSVTTSPPTSPQKETDLLNIPSLVNTELNTYNKTEKRRRYLEEHANDIGRLAPGALFKRLWQPICLLLLIIYAVNP